MKTPNLAAFALAALLGLAASRASATDRTETQQAAIRQEVTQAMHGMLAADERVDFAGVWAFHADVPTYLFADVDGKLYDYAGTKKVWSDFYAGCANLKLSTKREDVLVLGPDIALYRWHGAADITRKDGTTVRVDPWSATYLCRRISGAWKIVYGHESALPPQAVPPIQGKVGDDTAAVKQFAAELDRCSHAADLDGFMRQVAEDVVFLPPDQPAIEGAAAVREWYRAAWAALAIEMKHEVAEVSPAGDLIVTRGTATSTATPHAGGPPTAFNNKFLFVLKRTPDGSLKAWRVIFNSNAPATPAAN
jgi:ketosteroid isomerase-like protein